MAVTINSYDFDSKCPPFAVMVSESLLLAASQLARTVSSGIFAHSLVILWKRSSLLRQQVALTFPSTRPYMEKSKGLRSGEEGGQKLLSQKWSKLALHHAWTEFAV